MCICLCVNLAERFHSPHGGGGGNRGAWEKKKGGPQPFGPSWKDKAKNKKGRDFRVGISAAKKYSQKDNRGTEKIWEWGPAGCSLEKSLLGKTCLAQENAHVDRWLPQKKRGLNPNHRRGEKRKERNKQWKADAPALGERGGWRKKRAGGERQQRTNGVTVGKKAIPGSSLEGGERGKMPHLR